MPCLSMEKTLGLLPSNLPLLSQTINPKPRQTENNSGVPTTAHYGLETRTSDFIQLLIYLVIYLDESINVMPFVSLVKKNE